MEAPSRDGANSLRPVRAPAQGRASDHSGPGLQPHQWVQIAGPRRLGALGSSRRVPQHTTQPPFLQPSSSGPRSLLEGSKPHLSSFWLLPPPDLRPCPPLASSPPSSDALSPFKGISWHRPRPARVVRPASPCWPSPCSHWPAAWPQRRRTASLLVRPWWANRRPAHR